ncbi:MAG: hypothetical protein NC328_08110 [Muribaculum sp.]|nr:hypothetical protein [Muribaculum sp.]
MAKADFDFKEMMKKAMYDLNAQMPMPMGEMGMITSVTMEGDTLIYRLEVDFLENNGLEMKTKTEYKPEFVKNAISSLIHSNKAFKSSLGLISGSGLWMKYDIHYGDYHTSMVLSPSDIKSIIDSKPDYKAIVSNMIAQYNRQLPMELAGMKITKYELEGNCLVIYAIVDESYTNMDVMAQNSQLIKSNMLEMLKSGREPATSAEFYNTAMAGYTMVYKYVGGTSGKTVIVELAPAEVLESVSMAPNLN